MRFVMEAYIELLIGTFISFKLFDIRSSWNNWDHAAVGGHFIGLITVIAFFIFTCWFVFYKIVPLADKMKAELDTRHKEQLAKAHAEFKQNQYKNMKTVHKSQTVLLKMFSTVIRNQSEHRKVRLEETENVHESDYEVYAPLRAGLSPHS